MPEASQGWALQEISNARVDWPYDRVCRQPKTDLLDDDQMLRLLENFVYIDPMQQVWTAEKDALVDGASIPRVFWRITGGPLDSQFRNASIVHDAACFRTT